MTAANSSQISDGAAALLVMSEGKARALGLRPTTLASRMKALGLDRRAGDPPG